MLSDNMAVIYLVLSFGIGSIPFGLILTRLFSDINLRQIGSGNIGATNVLRTGRKGLAVATLLADALKGGIAVLCVDMLAGENLAALCGLAAVLGHCFPIWLKFRGGKGVATGIATVLAINWQLGLICIAVWLVMAMLFRFSSLSALAGFGVTILLGWGTTLFDTGLIQLTSGQLLVISLLSALVMLRHHQNIIRLFAGTETKITFRK